MEKYNNFCFKKSDTSLSKAWLHTRNTRLYKTRVKVYRAIKCWIYALRMPVLPRASNWFFKNFMNLTLKWTNHDSSYRKISNNKAVFWQEDMWLVYFSGKIRNMLAGLSTNLSHLRWWSYPPQNLPRTIKKLRRTISVQRYARSYGTNRHIFYYFYIRITRFEITWLNFVFYFIFWITFLSKYI